MASNSGNAPALRTAGFTLIEISIVLVIIGLIIGGILVGQSLISASQVRATVTQIEKYNQAANTFYGKYGYLPGDIPAGPAAQFGFQARGSLPAEGDGNGVIEGNECTSATTCYGSGGIDYELSGETVVFWVDLSATGLIDGSFNTATEYTYPQGNGGPITFSSTPNVNALFPAAKIGGGNYIYVWSLGGVNYYGLSAITQVQNGGTFNTNPGLTVQQAYAIDAKIDDGLPESGNVMARYTGYYDLVWAGIWNGYPGATPFTGATGGSSTTCFDNGNNASNPMQYSLSEGGGNLVNCALSFRMQAGD